MRLLVPIAFAAVFASPFMVACGGDSAAPSVAQPDAAPAANPISLSFEARVGGEPFHCTETYSNLGKSRSTVRLLDFRLYVHDVRLVRRDGAEIALALTQDQKWQYDDAALLDFEDKSGSCINGTIDVNTSITGAAPPGDYTGLRFRLGLPFALNHGNAATAPSPLNLSGLFWSWNGGYKFLRADARVVGNDTDTFFIHIGSTGCQGDAADGGVSGCARPDVAEIELPSFDAAKNKVIVDYAALVSGSDFSGSAAGCMSDPTDMPCAPLFTRLGIDFETGKPAAGQVFFRAE